MANIILARGGAFIEKSQPFGAKRLTPTSKLSEFVDHVGMWEAPDYPSDRDAPMAGLGDNEMWGFGDNELWRELHKSPLDEPDDWI